MEGHSTTWKNILHSTTKWSEIFKIIEEKKFLAPNSKCS